MREVIKWIEGTKFNYDGFHNKGVTFCSSDLRSSKMSLERIMCYSPEHPPQVYLLLKHQLPYLWYVLLLSLLVVAHHLADPLIF